MTGGQSISSNCAIYKEIDSIRTSLSLPKLHPVLILAINKLLIFNIIDKV
jgi:hypothetical protein